VDARRHANEAEEKLTAIAKRECLDTAEFEQL
jgi:hypothetical protein